VELFKNGTSLTPIAVSGVKTVYVSVDENPGSTQGCNATACSESAEVTYTAPPSALKTEMSKAPFLYFGVNLLPGKKIPPDPKWLLLGTGHGVVLETQQMSATVFQILVSFSFTPGKESWNATYAVCIKETLATDGVGLPGHHSCGNQRIPYPTGYVG
jgi:hypothetical protein